jgi:Domain of unknown function (DUF4157)
MDVRVMRETGATSQVPSRKPMVVRERPTAILQRCGSGGCPPGACNHSDERLLAHSATRLGPEFAPPIVSEVLASPGRPLEPIPRTDMEIRFRHDFSQVRVHTDAMAATSARAVDALAYTVGNDIVFDNGRYEPDSPQGRRLLAHELTHVLQQGPLTSGSARLRLGATNDALEQTADQVAAQSSPVTIAPVMVPRHDVVRRQQARGPASALDERARAIIAMASDQKVAAESRAVQVVRNILDTYFPADAAELVSRVVFDSKVEHGLKTEAVTGPTTKGTIKVGNDFLSGTTAQNFAHRVLQVDHELEHIRQHRRGMGGHADQPLREFLAFHREALEPELPGTGHIQISTRVTIIDEALKNYCLFSSELRDRFADERNELLNARARHIATGRVADDIPRQPPTC